MGLRIGEVAADGGVSTSTVRYYERRGIIGAPRRTSAGYRVYDEGVVDRIRFVRRAQDLGFTLDEILELLALRVGGSTASCVAVEEATALKLERVQERLDELTRLRDVLQRLVRCCEAREPTGECPVLEMLAGDRDGS